MKKIILLLLAFILLHDLNAQSNSTYLVDVQGTIDLGLAPYIKRVIAEAESNSAKAIIFRINTFGGRVDAATQIKDAILDSKVPTFAYVDKRAISAGALITLSCETIVMSPGSSIGASTVVDETGQKQSEKYQSYMRSEMRSTAERTGRRTDIAEGMVDERVVVKGLDDDSTKLITLTSKEAINFGIADTSAGSLDELRKIYNLEDSPLTTTSSNWAEDFIRFLNEPIISSLLIMIGLVGMFVEIKTPGWGLPGTMALIALALFFGSGYLLDLVSSIEIIIFVIGVILLVVEIFVIPGFGVAGIIGVICIVAGIFLGLISDFPVLDFSFVRIAILQLAGSFIAGGVLIFGISKFLPKSKRFSHLILSDEESTTLGYTSNPDLKALSGFEGTSLTILRPSGTALINEKRVDVVTEGDYIDKGKNIVVVRVEGSKVVVKEKGV